MLETGRIGGFYANLEYENTASEFFNDPTNKHFVRAMYEKDDYEKDYLGDDDYYYKEYGDE